MVVAGIILMHLLGHEGDRQVIADWQASWETDTRVGGDGQRD